MSNYTPEDMENTSDNIQDEAQAKLERGLIKAFHLWMTGKESPYQDVRNQLIVYFPIVGRIAGDESAGLILCDLLHWFTPTEDGRIHKAGGIKRDGRWWVAVKRDASNERYGISVMKFDSAIKRLEAKGLIDTRRIKSQYHQNYPVKCLSLNWTVFLTMWEEMVHGVRQEKAAAVAKVELEKAELRKLYDDAEPIPIRESDSFTDQYFFYSENPEFPTSEISNLENENNQKENSENSEPPSTERFAFSLGRPTSQEGNYPLIMFSRSVHSSKVDLEGEGNSGEKQLKQLSTDGENVDDTALKKKAYTNKGLRDRTTVEQANEFVNQPQTVPNNSESTDTFTDTVSAKVHNTLAIEGTNVSIRSDLSETTYKPLIRSSLEVPTPNDKQLANERAGKRQTQARTGKARLRLAQKRKSPNPTEARVARGFLLESRRAARRSKKYYSTYWMVQFNITSVPNTPNETIMPPQSGVLAEQQGVFNNYLPASGQNIQLQEDITPENTAPEISPSARAELLLSEAEAALKASQEATHQKQEQALLTAQEIAQEARNEPILEASEPETALQQDKQISESRDEVTVKRRPISWRAAKAQLARSRAKTEIADTESIAPEQVQAIPELQALETEQAVSNEADFALDESESIQAIPEPEVLETEQAASSDTNFALDDPNDMEFYNPEPTPYEPNLDELEWEWIGEDEQSDPRWLAQQQAAADAIWLAQQQEMQEAWLADQGLLDSDEPNQEAHSEVVADEPIEVEIAQDVEPPVIVSEMEEGNSLASDAQLEAEPTQPNQEAHSEVVADEPIEVETPQTEPAKPPVIVSEVEEGDSKPDLEKIDNESASKVESTPSKPQPEGETDHPLTRKPFRMLPTATDSVDSTTEEFVSRPNPHRWRAAKLALKRQRAAEAGAEISGRGIKHNKARRAKRPNPIYWREAVMIVSAWVAEATQAAEAARAARAATQVVSLPSPTLPPKERASALLSEAEGILKVKQLRKIKAWEAAEEAAEKEGRSRRGSISWQAAKEKLLASLPSEEYPPEQKISFRQRYIEEKKREREAEDAIEDKYRLVQGISYIDQLYIRRKQLTDILLNEDELAAQELEAAKRADALAENQKPSEGAITGENATSGVITRDEGVTPENEAVNEAKSPSDLQSRPTKGKKSELDAKIEEIEGFNVKELPEHIQKLSPHIHKRYWTVKAFEHVEPETHKAKLEQMTEALKKYTQTYSRKRLEAGAQRLVEIDIAIEDVKNWSDAAHVSLFSWKPTADPVTVEQLVQYVMENIDSNFEKVWAEERDVQAYLDEQFGTARTPQRIAAERKMKQVDPDEKVAKLPSKLRRLHYEEELKIITEIIDSREAAKDRHPDLEEWMRGLPAFIANTQSYAGRHRAKLAAEALKMRRFYRQERWILYDQRRQDKKAGKTIDEERYTINILDYLGGHLYKGVMKPGALLQEIESNINIRAILPERFWLYVANFNFLMMIPLLEHYKAKNIKKAEQYLAKEIGDLEAKIALKARQQQKTQAEVAANMAAEIKTTIASIHEKNYAQRRLPYYDKVIDILPELYSYYVSKPHIIRMYQNKKIDLRNDEVVDELLEYYAEVTRLYKKRFQPSSDSSKGTQL